MVRGMATFHEHVRRAAKMRGGQVALAKEIGISQSEISRLCTSAKSIPLRTAKAIADITQNEVKLHDLVPELMEILGSRAA